MTIPPAAERAAKAPAPAPPFVARWDLDKTYLRTDFDTLRDLLRTAIERPDRKRSVPGAAALLRELGQTGARIHILSGSPRQMKSRLEEKLLIDRVRWDELTLKPNLSNIVRLRLRALRDQLGYKLPMLLDARARDQAFTSEPAALCEVLVGDDAEADAFVYSLYADVLAGQVEERLLRRVLDAGRVYSDAVDVCRAALARIERAPVVERILIHLDLQTPPSRFDDYGARVVPFYNYVQAAFVLAEDGHLAATAVLRVASELVLRHRFDADALARSYLDLMRRGHVTGKIIDALAHAAAELAAERRLASMETLLKMCDILLEYLRDPPEPRAREPIELDYVALAAKHRAGENRRKRLR